MSKAPTIPCNADNGNHNAPPPQTKDSESAAYTRKPEVHWTETKTTVTLRINIPDLKKYTFKIDDDKKTISFQSEDTPPKNYSFKLELTGRVSTTPEFIPLGLHLLVKLQKISRLKWDNITRVRMTSWWLKKDLSNLDSDDSDDTSDDGDAIGEGFGIPTPQKTANMNGNPGTSETQNGNRSCEIMPVDFESDDEDSSSSDSDISEI